MQRTIAATKSKLVFMSDDDQTNLLAIESKDADRALRGVCCLCGEDYARAGLGNSPYCFTCATHATCVCSDANDD